MERITGINYERVAWCCDDSGITLSQLALETGISEKTIFKAVEKNSELTIIQLSKISDYFGRGLLFFLDQTPLTIDQVHTPAFRTITNQKPQLSAKIRTLIERAERQRDIYISLQEELDNKPQFFSPPDLPKDITEAAKIARQWLGLGLKNNFESYRAAIESKGILAFRSNGYNGKWQISKESSVLGFSLYEKRCPIIFIKKQDAETRQSFTLMHELGHILLHRKSSIDDIDDFSSLSGPENEANSFAGKLLVPDDFLYMIQFHNKPFEPSEFDEWLFQPRKLWGVSTEVILRRLLDNKKISSTEYNEYRAWRNNLPTPEASPAPRMYRHREPKNIFGDRFVRTILDSLSAKHISLSKASTYLDGLRINDLHKLEDHYAGI